MAKIVLPQYNTTVPGFLVFEWSINHLAELRMEETIPSNQRRLLSRTDSDHKTAKVEYTPAGVRRNGMGEWRVMVNDLVSSRRLIWLLILRDISARYRQSVLGYVWAVIPQVVTVGVFAFLNASRVLPIGGTRIAYLA